MEKQEGYWVDNWADGFDALAWATEALELYPKKTNITPEVLAWYVKVSITGRYVRVGETEGYDRKQLDQLRSQIGRWVMSERRIMQIQDTLSEPRWFKAVELSVEHSPCPKAKRRAGKQLDPAKLERLPLKGRWRRCLCDYRLMNKHEVNSE